MILLGWLLVAGLVFGGLAWTAHRARAAARTLRAEARFGEVFAAELAAAQAKKAAAGLPAPAATAAGVRGRPLPPPPSNRSAGADVSGAQPAHVQLVRRAFAERAEQAQADGAELRLVWVRSAGAHVAWGERRESPAGAREVLSVARVDGGRFSDRWTFG